MARRLNYTGRRSIKLSDVRIQLIESGEQLSFSAQFNLEEYRFPSDATLHVEAYRGLSAIWKRFDFGTIQLRQDPPSVSLSEFGHAEGILFRVKVAAPGVNLGRLCGEVDGIRPRKPDEDQGAPQPLIDVDKGAIGWDPWRVQLPEGNAGIPHLIINDKIEDWHAKARDPLFRALVLPSVMRQILNEVLVLRADVGDEESQDEWPQKWLRFSGALPGVGAAPAPLKSGERLDEREDISEWIDSAVSGFAQRSGLMEQLISLWKLEP